MAVFQGPLRGYVEFVQKAPRAPLEIRGRIEGLSPGLHGFHVHRLGDLRRDCASCSDHWNPSKQHHGALEGPSHAGDLGNLRANKKGVARVSIRTRKMSLFGRRSILGRSIIVHADPDDLGQGPHLDSTTTGHSGSRLDCAVIGWAE